MSQNYKDTLTLPTTDFPMKADLVIREPQRLEQWEKAGLYRQIQEARAGAELYILHDGPPFANGDVHMGTALNKILKDIIVKSRSMAGLRAPFVPGWDCHGLPIEFKVVKESRGLQPAEVRRRSEEYARKYVDIQRGQFKRLGILGEWEKPYLTLDPSYEAEIIRSFAVFAEQGLVYQSKKPVYWSTGAQTALAEAEVEYADREDPAIFVKFPLVSGPLAGKASMVIWTTTPWTLPANVAIAVAPKHEYIAATFRSAVGAVETFVIAKSLLPAFAEAAGWTHADGGSVFLGSELAGSEAQHPFLDRTARVITADFVTMESGTGQVHIAPGHGADDYLSGIENGLPILSPVDDHGRFTEEVGVPVWAGKYVFDANKEVVAHLRERGVLIAEQIYKHSYPHCWRSKTPVVFRAVEQFFIRIDRLRAMALNAIGQVEWIPAWGRNRISSTVETRPDWCISRQRSWGVPLPVFYDEAGKAIVEADVARKVADIVERDGTNVWFERDDAWWAQAVGLPAGSTRRNDTLDVWIDSGVSHRAVMQKRSELQPDGAAGSFRPADLYIEATDQHRGWFQSSLMTSVALNAGQAPYRAVLTHGFVVDKDTRKKVSKSEQGTYAKPMNADHFIAKYGADIVRLWASSVEFTSEVPFSEENFSKVLAPSYRQFRNVIRVLLANICGLSAEGSLEGASTLDRWMLSKLSLLVEQCRAAYAAYDFRQVFQLLNTFVAVEVSSLYVDITKDRLYCDAPNSPRRVATQTVMRALVDALCRLLAPILAFTADEAWEHFKGSGSVHTELFPEAADYPRDEEAERLVQRWLELRGVIAQEIEPARQSKLIGNSLEASIALQVTEEASEAVRDRTQELEEFLIISELRVEPATQLGARLAKTEQARCARCWRHKASVGASAAHPDLCDRCAEVLTPA